MESRFREDMKIYRLGKNVHQNLMKIVDEAEAHRVDYHTRSMFTEDSQYWKGRRDEAGFFRDAILKMLESLE